jgi:hypothetical protein
MFDETALQSVGAVVTVTTALAAGVRVVRGSTPSTVSTSVSAVLGDARW